MKRKKRLGSSNKDHEPTANSDQETTTESSSKGKVGRRGFLKIGAGAAAVTLANPLESIAQRRRSTSMVQAATSDECNDIEFSEPKPVFAKVINGQSVLDYVIKAEALNWSFSCPGQTTPTTSTQPVFNGALPGPSLYVDPGTLINLELFNNLNINFSGDNCPGAHHLTPPQPACYNHTNLHVHGLQVSPCSLLPDGTKHCGWFEIKPGGPKLKCSSDDVLIDIYPGASNKYCIWLPDMHAPGTNWYHSHLHGASAYQVSGGMAGAIIIREPPEGQIVREDLDKVFVLQEIVANPTPLPKNPPVYGFLSPGGGGLKSQVFVNGLCRPTLKMNAGQTMRWRFINIGATPRTLTKLRLVKTQTCTNTVPPPSENDQIMWLIAIDGLSFYGINPQPVRYHLMGNGNRADFLINLEPGTYTLVKDGYPLESVQKPGSTNYTAASKGSTQALAYINVQPSSYTENVLKDVPTVPGKKPLYLNAIWTVDKVRSQPVMFQNPNTATFKIDNNFYDMNPPIDVGLNTAEEWTLQNFGFPSPANPPQTNTHPFHVHLNPFQILGIAFDFEVSDADLQRFNLKRMNASDPCTWPFWDTVPLPAQIPPQTGPPGQLKIRSRFLIYDGEYVTHCHILVHEDVGMMINVRLIGDGVGPNVAVHDYPPPTRLCIDRTSKPCPTT